MIKLPLSNDVFGVYAKRWYLAHQQVILEMVLIPPTGHSFNPPNYSQTHRNFAMIR